MGTFMHNDCQNKPSRLQRIAVKIVRGFEVHHRNMTNWASTFVWGVPNPICEDDDNEIKKH